MTVPVLGPISNILALPDGLIIEIENKTIATLS